MIKFLTKEESKAEDKKENIENRKELGKKIQELKYFITHSLFEYDDLEKDFIQIEAEGIDNNYIVQFKTSIKEIEIKIILPLFVYT